MSPTRPVKKLQFDQSVASDGDVFGLVTPDDLSKKFQGHKKKCHHHQNLNSLDLICQEFLHAEAFQPFLLVLVTLQTEVLSQLHCSLLRVCRILYFYS